MKACLLLLLLIGGGVGYHAYYRYGPPAEPFHAYVEHATARTRGEHDASQRALAPVFTTAAGTEITRIDYRLEALAHRDERTAELDVIQEVFHQPRMDGAVRTQVRRSRHRVVMRRVGDDWTLSSADINEL